MNYEEARKWLQEVSRRRRAGLALWGLTPSTEGTRGRASKPPAQAGTRVVRTTEPAVRRDAQDVGVVPDIDAVDRSEVSDVCQALCSFVAEAEVSAKALPALLAALAAAKGHGPDEFFRQSGVELGRRLGKSDASEQGHARRWSRAWRLIEAEQRRTGLTLVERRRGDEDPATKQKQSFEYRVPLAQIVVDVLLFSRRYRRRGIRRADQYERAAQDTIALLPRDYNK